MSCGTDAWTPTLASYRGSRGKAATQTVGAHPKNRNKLLSVQLIGEISNACMHPCMNVPA